MSEIGSTPARSTPSWPRLLWSGRGKPATRWGSLFSGILALALAWASYTLAISSLRWAMPLKLIGWALLLATLALLFVGVRALLRTLLQMGIKRLLIRLGILYALAVILVAWLVPSGQTGIGHIISSAGSILGWMADGVRNMSSAAIQAPAAVGFAATGKRAPVRVPGVDWVGDVPPTPIVAFVDEASSAEGPGPITPSTTTTPDEALQIGDTVRVVNTDGQGLRARDIPNRDGKILFKFAENSTVQIIDGPKEADGFTWWKVRGTSGEGWCVADFLTRET